MLIKAQLLEEPLDFAEVMSYQLTPVPLTLATSDGYFAKTNKAAMMHYVLDEYQDDVSYPEGALFIQDGMALLHALTNLQPTFGDICIQILNSIAMKENFIFSTDSYEPESIKTQERKRRGSSEKFIVDGPATRKPADFKLFLANEENKLQFCKLLLQVWGSKKALSCLKKCGTSVLVVDGRAYRLDPSDHIVSF